MTEQLLIQSLLVVTTVIAVVYDVRTNRIPNRLILAALLAAILLNAVRGMPQLVDGLLGFGVALAIGVIPFFFGWLGAGDVKFLAALGAMIGMQYVPRLFFYTAIAGAVLGLVSLVYRRCEARRGFAAAAKEAYTDLKAMVLSQGRVLPSGVRSKVSEGAQAIPYGVAIGAGALFAVFLDPTGGWAGF